MAEPGNPEAIFCQKYFLALRHHLKKDKKLATNILKYRFHTQRNNNNDADNSDDDRKKSDFQVFLKKKKKRNMPTSDHLFQGGCWQLPLWDLLSGGHSP